MVKLCTSLLALTLVTGSALASSHEYQRRDLRHARIGIVINTPSDHFQSRGFDDDQDHFERDLEAEDFSEREYLLDARDTFDDLEARQPSLLGSLTHLGEGAVKGLAKSKVTKTAIQAAGKAAGKYSKAGKVGATAVKMGQRTKVGKIGKIEGKISRKLADKIGHTKIGRKVDPKVRRKVTAKVIKKIRKGTVRQAKQSLSSNQQQPNQQPSNNNSKAQRLARQQQQRIDRDIKRAKNDIAQVNRYLPTNQQVHTRSLGLEDDEDLSRRDLDIEELFGRDYDLLDERDIFDDLD